MRSVPAASHSEHSTKITVVVTLWLITSYLMLHVPSILRNVFSVFNVWNRLVTMFHAQEDKRVPKFQTYIHILAYVCTCVWAIVRTTLCFKYNHKLRKALGPWFTKNWFDAIFRQIKITIFFKTADDLWWMMDFSGFTKFLWNLINFSVKSTTNYKFPSKSCDVYDLTEKTISRGNKDNHISWLFREITNNPSHKKRKQNSM